MILPVPPSVPPTERLRFDPLTVADAGEMVHVLADADLYRFTGGSPPDLDTLRRRYRAQAAGVSPDGCQTWLNWIVRLRSDGIAVGYTQATVERTDGTAELAWVIGVPWQGQGFAREAVTSMVESLRTSGTRRLVAHVHPDHPASQRLAALAGLSRTGRLVDGEEEWEWRAP